MTAEQEILKEILLIAESRDSSLACGVVFTGENVEEMYGQVNVECALQDYEEEFRQDGEETGLECEWNRNYESDAVGKKLRNGKWVGWTYWYGGGKHGNPEEIDWMSDAYFLEVEEKEKIITVRTFKKKE